MSGKSQDISKYKTIEYLNATRKEKCLLTVIKYDKPKISKNGKPRRQLICKCECGKDTITDYYNFIYGATMSCGCLFLKVHTKYYPVIEEIYIVWYHMNRRCDDPKHISYINYGARGVTVCDEWKNDYQKFLDWALLHGWEKGLNIDKDIIPKQLGLVGMLYCPEYCCFVTTEENNNTKRNCVTYDYNGEKLNLAQIEKITGIGRSTIRYRMKKRGMTLIEATKTIANA